MLTPRGHPHIRGDSFFRYYTFQQPDYVYPQPKKEFTCKEKFFNGLKYYFSFLKSE